MSKTAFAAELETATPQKGEVSLFWLDQSHFIVKTPGGALIHFDPYLSRVVKTEFHIHPEPLLKPEEARADFVFLTHDHRDHTDRYTLGPMARSNPDCLFVGTPEAAERCRRDCGVPENRILVMREGDRREFPLPKDQDPAAFTVRAVFAQDTADPPATTHQGYVFEFNQLRIYHVGDTRKNPDAYADRLGPVANLRPDVMLVPINEGYDNPGPAGAVRLMEIVRPLGMAVPCHYGCFTYNTIDPARFIAAAPAELRPLIVVLPRGGLTILGKVGRNLANERFLHE